MGPVKSGMNRIISILEIRLLFGNGEINRRSIVGNGRYRQRLVVDSRMARHVLDVGGRGCMSACVRSKFARTMCCALHGWDSTTLEGFGQVAYLFTHGEKWFEAKRDVIFRGTG